MATKEQKAEPKIIWSVLLECSNQIKSQLPNPWHLTQSSPNRTYFLKKENSNFIRAHFKLVQDEVDKIQRLYSTLEIKEMAMVMNQAIHSLLGWLPEFGSIKEKGNEIVEELDKIDSCAKRLEILICAEGVPPLESPPPPPPSPTPLPPPPSSIHPAAAQPLPMPDPLPLTPPKPLTSAPTLPPCPGPEPDIKDGDIEDLQGLDLIGEDGDVSLSLSPSLPSSPSFPSSPTPSLTPSVPPSSPRIYELKSSFYYYLGDDRYILGEKRPTNQSGLPVLRKISGRLQRLSKQPHTQLTPIQLAFEARGVESLKAISVDIAHNIAISEIMKTITECLNRPRIEIDPIADEFFEEILSSDDEDGKAKLKEDFRKLRHPHTLPQQKLQLADEVTKRINRASPNLSPGHASTNRSIQEWRDPHLVVVNGVLREHARSKRIASVAKRFLVKSSEVGSPRSPASASSSPYSPKTRTNKETKRKQAQSSSAGKIPSMSKTGGDGDDRSYFDYDSPSEDEYKLLRSRSSDAKRVLFSPLDESDASVLSSKNLPEGEDVPPLSPIVAPLNSQQVPVE